MNTTTAATEARVTVATIRTWCRRGVVAATKTAGRWVIDSASLTRRIEIGARMSSPTTRYTIVEGANQYGTTTWTVTRTDGTEAGFGPGKDSRIRDMVFIKKDHAEIAAGVLEQLPEEYRFAKREVRYHSSSINSNHWVWEVTGGTSNDPKELKTNIRVDTDSSVEEVITHLMKNVHAHAQGAADRIAKKAEQDAIAAAEATVREAREAQLAEARRTKGPLATPKQVDFILQLLARRERTGEGGGFFYGPTDRAGIEEMSKAEASTYITSLKGDY
jgi:hypothetical protein